MAITSFLFVIEGSMLHLSQFLGSANPLNVFLIPPNYDITRKSKMAAKMAAVRSITLIRFIVILERSFCVYSKAFQVAEYARSTLAAIGWIFHC